MQTTCRIDLTKITVSLATKAPMPKLNLLTLCDSPNQAEELTSLVRTLGVAVSSVYVDSSSQLLIELEKSSNAIVLVTITQERTSLPKFDDNKKPAMLALIEDGAPTTAGELILQGAIDVAVSTDIPHIKHCVARAIEQQSQAEMLEARDTQLKDSENRLDILLQSTPQPIAYLHQGMHVYANPAYLSVMGYSSLEDLQAMPVLDILTNPDERSRFTSAIRELESGRGVASEIPLSLTTSDDEEISYQVKLAPSNFDGESVTQLLLINQLASDDVLNPEPRLPGPQISDPVTQLYSNHHMTRLLENTIAHTRDSGTEYMLYLVHLETGPDDPEYTDKCMQAAAVRLLNCIDENDVLGRYSGNTFLLLTLHHKHVQPTTYAETLRTAIDDLDGLLPGITRSRVSAVIVDKYCNHAAHALSRLKETFIQAQETDEPVRIDTTQFQHMPGSKVMDQVWARQVSTILKNNRLTLISQQIISLRQDEWDRVNLQLHLSDETGDDISLDQFRDTVVHTGLASSVDRWIIFNAARQLLEVLRETPTTQFFIPLIGNVMLEDDLYPWIEKVIEQFKLPKNSIMLEATVDSALKYPDAFADFCKRMTAMNCGVYLTGLDDPTITHELYADSTNKIKYLALDKSLLDGLTTDMEKHEAVEILVAQCHRENTLTIVPNVVDAEVLSELWKLGVDLFINANQNAPSDEMLALDLTATLSA